MQRLDRLVARNTGASRKTVTRWCKKGVLTDPRGEPLAATQKVPPHELPLEILLDGERTLLHDEHHVLLHKPAGVVTAMKDGLHPTAYALVEHYPLSAELRAVGRLDLDCTGLLLWTTCGPLVHKLTHPKYKVPRVYQVALARAPTHTSPPKILEDGTVPHVVSWTLIELDALHPSLQQPAEARCFAQICLYGGAYHEVKRIFAAMGSHVLALSRVQHGRLALPRDLAPGASVSIPRAALEQALAAPEPAA